MKTECDFETRCIIIFICEQWPILSNDIFSVQVRIRNIVRVSAMWSVCVCVCDLRNKKIGQNKLYCKQCLQLF